MRLNVFTPLPPLMTDIAGHSAGVLPHLAELAEVVAWSTQPGTTAELGRATFRRFDPDNPPFAAFNDADASVFNFGNNAQFHREIFQVAAQVPGVAVLHDLNLQHFFAALAQSGSGAPAYLRQMTRDYGPEGEAAAVRLLAGECTATELVDRFPLTLGVAGRALALVTHNAAAVDELRRQTRIPVHLLPLSLRGLGPPPPERVPGPPPFRLIVFGYIGGNRRLPAVLRALAAAPERERFRLGVYGELEDRAGTEALIAQLGLQQQVSCHGFVSDAALAQALAAADLAINLRFPTMGEASGSQLRIWSHALPSLVTRIGWYGALPEDAVFFVEPEQEQRGLLHHLSAFAADPRPFIAAGRRGRSIVEAVHAPAAYAEGLLHIADAIAPLHRRRGATDLARTAARRAAELGAETVLPAVAPAVARHISQLFGAPPPRR